MKEDKKKDLTERQKQQRKKLLIMPLFFLLFLASLYWIFAPKGGEEKPGNEGYNVNVPDGKNAELIGDKRKAYEAELYARKEDEKRRTLQDFAFSVANDSSENEAFDLKIDDAKTEKKESPVLHSQSAYKNMTNELNSFYNSPSDNSREKELQRQIQELNAKLSEKESNENNTEKQLAMMEKSYQMASKYLKLQPEAEQPPVILSERQTVAKKPKVSSVKPLSENVVSALPQPISDSAFFEQMQQPRNLGFFTVAGQSGQRVKNTIKACVLADQTIKGGQPLKLRLLEALQIGETVIPVNTEITGETTLQNERLLIKVTAIQSGGNIFPVELNVFDTDGMKGIRAPGSLENDVMKEAVANIGGNLGQSITINRNAGQQIVSDLTRGVLQAGSQYVGAKARQIKIHVKANYEVLLLPKEDN